jgi:hypothetical protein
VDYITQNFVDLVDKILIHYCITRFLVESTVDSIAEMSSLTKVQLETLKIHLALRNHQITMREALESRKNSRISRGTHYRVLGQAKKNVRQSLLTVVVAAQMGLIKPEELQKLVATVSLIPDSVDSERLAEVLALVDALAERIVML